MTGSQIALVSNSMNTSTCRRRSNTVSTLKKSHAMIPLAWERRNSAQLGPERRGAGSSPWRLRIDHTVDAPRVMPMVTSSPWIRR